MAPPMEDGEMTSDDPFVKQIDESIQKEMGVGLDELLNPAKVVNLERDLYNLRNELATLTGATLPIKDDDDSNAPLLTTQLCDAGGGGEDATTIRSKISKKEKDLANERRAVFRGWLKNIFLGQALLSMALSYVMSTNPDALFGSFPWYNTISNMDTSISVLGFWWWWLFIVPSLRSRRPSGWEKEALDIAFLGTPLISILSPVVTKDTGVIWMANFAVVVGAYGFAYLGDGGEDGGSGGEDGGKNSLLLHLLLCLHRCPPRLLHQQTLTIAPRDGPIGWQVGQFPRRNGAAGSMARAAQDRAEEVVPQPPSRMIAMLDLPIGWQGGVLPRRRGAARTKARAAHQQQEGAPEQTRCCE